MRDRRTDVDLCHLLKALKQCLCLNLAREALTFSRNNLFLAGRRLNRAVARWEHVSNCFAFRRDENKKKKGGEKIKTTETPLRKLSNLP